MKILLFTDLFVYNSFDTGIFSFGRPAKDQKDSTGLLDAFSQEAATIFSFCIDPPN
jgi:hypothetical protein